MSTYICKKIKTFLEIDETFVPLLNNTAHSQDYEFYSSDAWLKEVCGAKYLQSLESQDYESFMATCIDASTSSVPDSSWVDEMKGWIASFMNEEDTTELMLDVTEKILEKATEAATASTGQTHWVPTVDTTTTTPPPDTTSTDDPDPTPKGGDSSIYGPVMIALGACSWLLPIGYYLFKRYRGK